MSTNFKYLIKGVGFYDYNFWAEKCIFYDTGHLQLPSSQTSKCYWIWKLS